MKNQKRSLFVVAAFAVAAAFGCAPAEQTRPAAPTSNEVPIGLYAALTGSTATFGQATREGVQFAIDEINAAGGINGKKLRLIVEDDQGKPEEAAAVVTKLITRDNVVAIIGENASSNTLAAAPIAQSNRVPMVSPSSTNPQVTEKGDFIFRVCFIDPLQGQAIARFATDNLSIKKAAILQDVKSDYSVGLADVFTKEFEKRGGQITIRQSFSAGDSDFRSQLTAIKQTNPQAIFIPSYYTEAGQIAIQARDLGITVPLLGGDGWDSPKLLEIGGKSLEGCYYATTVSLESPDPAVQQFVKKFKEKTKKDPEGLNALGYDAVYVIANAMKSGNTTEPKAIRDALAQTQNYAGASGTISFGPDRNPLKPVPIVAIKDGKTQFLVNVRP